MRLGEALVDHVEDRRHLRHARQDGRGGEEVRPVARRASGRLRRAGSSARRARAWRGCAPGRGRGRSRRGPPMARLRASPIASLGANTTRGGDSSSAASAAISRRAYSSDPPVSPGTRWRAFMPTVSATPVYPSSGARADRMRGSRTPRLQLGESPLGNLVESSAGRGRRRELVERLRYERQVFAVDQEAGATQRFGDGSRGACHHRYPAGERLDERRAEALVHRHREVHVRAAIPGVTCLGRDRAGEQHADVRRSARRGRRARRGRSRSRAPTRRSRATQSGACLRW